MTDKLSRNLWLAGLLIVFAFGAWMRINPSTKIDKLGYDENYYRLYLTMLKPKGLALYPMIAGSYVAAQAEMPAAIIPPTRVTFIASAYLCERIFKSGPLVSLRSVSCLFTVLSLAVAALFAWRIADPPVAFGVTALMSCAPLQIQMAQRVYVDGVFAFWALLTLWLLWENLRAPNHHGWLTAYIVSLALMVMTKENAAFVFLAIVVIIALNRWMQFGKVTPRLMISTLLGPALGVLGLAIAAGGIITLINVFKINVERSYAIPYAIKTGDGPWFRYVLDLITMSPVVTLLAIAGLVRPNDKRTAYFALFITTSYVVMANLRYGLNLRYASMWDMPLRWLAFGQLTFIATLLPPRFRGYFIGVGVAVACAADLNHYNLFFAQNGMYDPVPEPMLRVLNILK